MDTDALTTKIKQEALSLGFAACGICCPGHTDQYSTALKYWLEKGFHGEMSYMERHLEKRSDSGLLVNKAQSIIVTALNYYPLKKQNPEAAQISYYAYGKDYHVVVRQKLNNLFSFIEREVGGVQGRVFCDTAPFAEKYHAVKAGLGWVGKNTQLILPGKGSFFFLGAIFLDKVLVYDENEVPNRCGNCTRCMDACPTNALVAPGVLNATRCLSYLTIEHKGDLPDYCHNKAGDKVYGCDICNTVCPWNRFAKGSEVEEFQPSEKILNLSPTDVKNMNSEQFKEVFEESPVYRIGLDRLRRNVRK